MNRPLLTTIAGAALALAIASSAPARAAGPFEISVSAPSDASVGKPAALSVRGENPPPAEYWFNSYYSVEAVPAAIVPACPGGYEEASQMAVQTVAAGGGHVTPIWVREWPDAGGAWSSALAYTPSAAGRMLLCAYTNDGFANTLARGQTTLVVRAPGRPAKRCKKTRRGKKSAAANASAARKKCKARR